MDMIRPDSFPQKASFFHANIDADKLSFQAFRPQYRVAFIKYGAMTGHLRLMFVYFSPVRLWQV